MSIGCDKIRYLVLHFLMEEENCRGHVYTEIDYFLHLILYLFVHSIASYVGETDLNSFFFLERWSCFNKQITFFRMI